MKCILALILMSAASAWASTLPNDCVVRLKQVAAPFPGDDGTYSKPADVKISNSKLVASGVSPATGSPYANYSVNVSVAGFYGNAMVQDSAGSCYITNFNLNAP